MGASLMDIKVREKRIDATVSLNTNAAAFWPNSQKLAHGCKTAITCP